MKRLGLIAAIVLLAAAAPTTPSPLKSLTLGRGPTVVMIHSLGSTRASWMPTARKLMSSYRVVMVDLPGHGESALPDPFTLDVGAAQLDAVLAAQNPESTIVVGQGMGALIGLLALESHPSHARGLIAIEMSLKRQFAVSDQQRGEFLAFIDQNYDTFLKSMYNGLGRDSTQNVALYAQAAQVPQATMKAYVREMLSFDGTEGAKKLKTPLMMVTTDRLWTATAATDSASFVSAMGYAAVPPFSLRHMTHCGVLVASEQPDSLAALIAGFSRRTLAAR